MRNPEILTVSFLAGLLPGMVLMWVVATHVGMDPVDSITDIAVIAATLFLSLAGLLFAIGRIEEVSGGA